MEIAEQLSLLVQLQGLDGQIYDLRRKRDGFPLLIKRLEDEYKRECEILSEGEKRLRSLLVKQKEKENELASKEETIKKCESQLYQLKTNEEYATMKKEIGGHNADKSVLEDEIIGILDEAEAAKKDVEKDKRAMKEEEAKLKTEKARCAGELKEIEARLNSLNAERAGMAAKADRGILAKYERILKGKDGLALVPVREDSCGGCHMNLPPQVINEIRMKSGLVYCEACARILYIEE